MNRLVGVLGAGQLGRMLALAGVPMGLRFRFLDPAAAPCAGDVGDVVHAPWDDLDAVRVFADGCDVVTYEFENVPPATLAAAAEVAPVAPAPRCLAVACDRLEEKRAFVAAGLDVAPYASVDDAASLARAIESVGTPCLLKARTGGYDGKGQARVDDPAGAEAAWEAIGRVPCLCERRVDFSGEVSVGLVRRADGAVAAYPLARNVHEEGILVVSRAPAPDVSPTLARDAIAAVERLAADLDYVGMLAVELFETADGLLANEMAARVHNSFHWTMDGAVTSQFENHLRAILGWPLGPTAALGPAAMINLIGVVPDPADWHPAAGRHLHLYGKSARPGRKVGHVNVRAERAGVLEAAIDAVRLALPPNVLSETPVS